ncbi:phosphotyrosine protein phosphatases I [Myriangium duriaei CBS 260.36]|uniref:Phosphotyrosine protein phosphatases I n=1 Tax=Myriangium duriaei CBS 260.36 TaxID=1168546 RepID=A0A9P4J9A6_9PEZI|nr:phosphotyrosine protein phosphatases I [Myriangium duriaei CBS 260.36]
MSAADSSSISVLFVCLGNICRSPMAEGVFRHVTRFGLADADTRISDIDSCGTGAYHEGESPDSRTMAVLKQHGITKQFYQHAARKVVVEDFTKFDYIFAMDGENLRYLEQAKNRLIKKGDVDESKVAKLQLWGAYGGNGQEEVGDPYYGARNGFEIAYEQMVRFSAGFLKELDAGRL